MEARIEEKPFPDDLEERLRIIANAINTGFKTVTLLHLDSCFVNASGIHERIRETRGNGYLPDVGTFRSYGDALHNDALVARETTVRDTGDVEYVGYSLTKAGEKYGLPIAAFTMRYAVDNNRSMFSILGSTISHGETSAPYNRIRILEELGLFTGKLREADLAEGLHIDPKAIRQHLEALQEIGFVRFDSVGAKQKGKSVYLWKGKPLEEIDPVNARSKLTKRVAEHLAKYGRGEYNEIANALNYRSHADVSNTLSGLVKKGFVELERWKGAEVMSEVEILYDGKKFIEEWSLLVIGALQNESPLDEMNNLLEEFREDSETFGNYVRRKIELYKKVSPQINRKPSEKRVEEILGYLILNPGATTREISKGVGISNVRTRDYLRKISEQTRREKEGSEVRYFLAK